MTGELVTTSNLRAFFSEAIDSGCERQELELQQETRVYLSSLLEHFTHPDALQDGSRRSLHRPLAMILADAQRASRGEERRQHLRRLGDIALFVAGFFPGWVTRRPVDVGYYVGMGESAYGQVAALHRGSGAAAALGRMFQELAERFAELVQLLDDLIEESPFGSRRLDALRVHDLWLGSGRQLYGGRLQELGIVPHDGSVRH